MRLERRKRKERRKAKAHRTRYVNLRLNEREYQTLKGKAAAAQMSVSELLRDHVGRVRITPSKDRREILLALGRLGSNLNQLARWANTHKAGADALKVCFGLVELGKELKLIEGLVAGRGRGELGEAAS